MDKNGNHFYTFGPFSLNVTKRVVLRNGRPINLGAKAFDTLLVLITNRDREIGKEELLRLVWPTTSVSDNNLSRQILNVRRALGDDAREPADQYVQTIYGQGYRFMADVTEQCHSAIKPPPVPIPQLPETPPQSLTERPLKRNRWWTTVLALAAIAAVTLLYGIWMSARRHVNLPSNESARVGRILVRHTSQGQSLRTISLSHPSEYLAISPDGRTVYATNPNGRILSIMSTGDLHVRKLPLPRDAGPLAISTDGKLFIGSREEGIMVVDTKGERLLPRIIPTGGPVWDMEISPDGAKLFMAMDKAGLKRLSIRESKLSQLSNRICPLFLKMDQQGRNLYVTYQCGPKAGRNSMEIFDVAKEVLLATVTGPPMVGGDLAVSPDGRLVLIDGLNACETNEYDHTGCPPVPGRVYHLFRPADRQILTTFTFPHSAGKARFLDDSRFLLTGESLSVVDAVKSRVLETIDLNSFQGSTSVVAPDLSRIYVGYRDRNDLLILEPAKAECSPPAEGLTILFAGDGTLNDSAGICSLNRLGDVSFAPGKVGQAFSLNGKNSLLVAPWTGAYEFGAQDGTIALYVKFSEFQGERTLVYRMSKNEDVGWRLVKSRDDHIEFHKAVSTGVRNVVRSEIAVHENTWYHVVVTKTGQRVEIYVNGLLQGQTNFPGKWQFLLYDPLYLGATPKRNATLRGLLDEVAFYNRALTPKEIQAFYSQRESNPCKP